MSDVIILCVMGIAAIICIVGLAVIHFQEKKMKTKPTYYSAVGAWLHGKR